MPSRILKNFLDVNEVKYTALQHSAAYTSHEIAAAAHMSGWDLAKTVIVILDNALAMVVVPASSHVDLNQVEAFTGAENAKLATEEDFRTAFPDCEPGAMPPFGNLYNMPVYVDQLLQGNRLTFNAGSHRELITVDWNDFQRLVEPAIGRFTAKPFAHAAASAASRSHGV